MMRSLLFVPGDRPDRLEGAFERGASGVIADLEDAVSAESKEAALDTVVRWISGLPDTGAPVWVRVNDPRARETEIEALLGLPRLTGFLLPKTESAAEISAVAEQVTGSGVEPLIAPMIESAVGLAAARAIAACSATAVLHIGEADLAADLGLDPGPDETELAHARAEVVLASRLAGLPPPVAPVSLVLDDLDRFAASTRRLRRFGFRGRACIHPAQVAVANTVFTVSAEERAWADDVLARAEAVGHGAFRDGEGRFVDEAVLRRARAITGE